MKVPTILIPARLKSTRLPGKLLKDICGKTMLERVVAEAKKISDEVIVVGDSKLFEGDWDFILIPEQVSCGTERCALAMRDSDRLKDIQNFIIWQGDELLNGNDLKELVHMERDLFYPGCVLMTNNQQNLSVHQVKAVLNGTTGRILYFHRLHTADLLQIGIYIYPSVVLNQFYPYGGTTVIPSLLEKATGIEMNRIVEHARIRPYLIQYEVERAKLDTEEDLALLRSLCQNQDFPRSSSRNLVQ